MNINLKTPDNIWYFRWIKNFLSEGGRLTHYYDRNFNSSVVRSNSDKVPIPSSFGASSNFYFIEEEQEFFLSEGNAGHNKIYKMNNHSNIGFVPMYKDISELLISSDLEELIKDYISEFINKSLKKDKKFMGNK